MERIVERVCGIDVHKATLSARVRVGRSSGRVEQEIRSFGTTSDELLELRQWLQSFGVTQVAMEATGVYWKPAYYGEVISHRFARRTTCARRGRDADLLSGGRWGAPLARSRTSSRRGPGLLLRRRFLRAGLFLRASSS